ncbi:hypothetical protein PMIN03_005843 [Paraphaeosphaeria minitans]|uniref:Uncharacterized protein n=1 Tax=Paraphaeosphaeria minitans TaxID=565426 RepID=A0A9P6GJ90_9PLEO|nr:hypothetical protein PMIN01_06589 [Paraphaeosphaeria minitans]
MRNERTPDDSPSNTPERPQAYTRQTDTPPAQADCSAATPQRLLRRPTLRRNAGDAGALELFVGAVATHGDRHHATLQCLLDTTCYDGRRSRNIGKCNRTAKALYQGATVEV